MHNLTLGATEIEVSEWCLGTMTWGRQTPATDAHLQIDRALDAGIDFVDTAEMYPVNPVLAETIGDTETILGDWIARTGGRDRIVLATKCTGPSALVRDGTPITPETLREALERSLTRLRTDHVDLYQMHWPNRGSYHFRQFWDYDPTGQDRAETHDGIAALMETLKAFRAEGKIRAFGLSNDTAWGIARWSLEAGRQDGPGVATTQNEYSLLCRLYDGDAAEASHHEQVTCLAYSPLAAGLLTGKYQNGRIPEGSRMATNGDLGGRKTDRAFAAVDAYLGIAQRHGLDPVHMALAFCRSRPVPTIPILGATDTAQLDRILGGIGVSLGDEALAEIDRAHRDHPMPY